MNQQKILIENLPRDLAVLYRNQDSDRQYSSQRHPQTRHGEIRPNYYDSATDEPSNRRNIYYDYAASTYLEVPAEVAIKDINNDKSHVSNYRLIFEIHGKPELIEYEIRDNNVVYSIYGKGGKGEPVEVGQKEYPNIRYAPWRTVFKNAKKIYWTDEYDHQLVSDPGQPKTEIENARQQEQSYAKITRGFRPYHKEDNPADYRSTASFDQDSPFYQAADPEYDEHKHYQNWLGASLWQQDISLHTPDTGDHKNFAKNMQYAPTQAMIQKLEKSGVTQYSYYNNFFKNSANKAYQQKKSSYLKYDALRKALKKLDTEKERLASTEYPMSDAEYLDKKTRWSDALKKAYNEYLTAAEAYGDYRRAIIKYIDEDSFKSLSKIDNLLSNIEIAKNKIHVLSQIIKDLQNNDPTAQSYSPKYNAYHREYNNYKVADTLTSCGLKVTEAADQIAALYRSIIKLRREILSAKNQIDATAGREGQKENQLDVYQKQQEEFIQQYNKYQSEYFKIYEEEMTKVQNEVRKAEQYLKSLSAKEDSKKSTSTGAKDSVLQRTDIITFD